MKSLVQARLSNALNSNQAHYDYAFIESFIVSGCIGVIQTRLNHANPKFPEEMSVMCNRLLTKGSFLF